MPLANPLTTDMINAAGNIHKQLDGWQATDKAIVKLRESLPGFDLNNVLLKATVVNSLYSTNVYAITRAADHVYSVIKRNGHKKAGAGFVEEISRVPDVKTKSGKDRKFTSFASKFAHFFIDQGRFPIYDTYAVSAIKYHLGRGKWEKNTDDRPYEEFVQNFIELREISGYKGSTRNLDYYLWLAGLFLAWNKNKDAKINQEVKVFFGNVDKQELIQQAFKGRF